MSRNIERVALTTCYVGIVAVFVLEDTATTSWQSGVGFIILCALALAASITLIYSHNWGQHE